MEADIKRVVLCSGKVFYDLHAEREKQGKVGALAEGERAGLWQNQGRADVALWLQSAGRAAALGN